MTLKPITDQDKNAYNKAIAHPLQSWEWGQFREKTGLKVIRRGIFIKDKLINGFQLTIHPIPHTPWTIGYLPKVDAPTKEILGELLKIGTEEKCIFIQLEPNVERSSEPRIQNSEFKIQPAAHPLFTNYTFILDLTKSEEELLKGMHPKTRYNIKVAQRHGVEVKEDNSDEAFEKYWQLTEQTTKRQGFYAHTKRYHRLQWDTLPHTVLKNELSSHLFAAKYSPQFSTLNSQSFDKLRIDPELYRTGQLSILTTMLFFVFHDTLYYPYGASSDEHRNVMHSTLTMWEAIRWGQKMGLKKFDMWGALGPDPDPDDPWLGFHIFKQRFGAELIEFVGSYDLIINPYLYQLYKITDKLRWLYLHIKK